MLGARRSLPWWLALALAPGLASGGEEPDAPVLAPCALEGVPGGGLCGTFEVAEDRSLAGGRRLRLRLVVLPAKGGQVAPDPVVILTGGPGQAASAGAAREAVEHDALREHRDIVLLDQRGTGGSHRLPCVPPSEHAYSLILGPPPPAAAIARCRDELSREADLTRYTSLDAVADLEELSRAAGWDRINLVAGSYGTRVALLTMRLHPERVRTAVLQGVSPPGSANPLPFARAGQASLDALLAACAADPACAGDHRRLGQELAEVLARLSKAPAVVELPDPATGAPVRVELTRALFVSRLHLMLLAGPLAVQVPGLVHLAHAGDWRPFAELAAAFGRAINEQIDFGMQLSVICAEDAPFLTPERVAAETAGTLLGRERVDQILAYCREWPARPLPADFTAAVRTRVPTLIVAGEVDPVTPASLASAVAAELPLARLVVLPGASHVDGAECVGRLAAQLVTSGGLDGLDETCVSAVRRLPFRRTSRAGGDAHGIGVSAATRARGGTRCCSPSPAGDACSAARTARWPRRRPSCRRG